MPQEVYTITYGDQAENHVGMRKIGELSENGFDLTDLKKAQNKFNKIAKTELINLTTIFKDSLKNKDAGKYSKIDSAYLLIIRNGVDGILKSIDKSHNDLYKEHQNIEYDNKAFMYGRVVNKIARHNVCFDDKGLISFTNQYVLTILLYPYQNNLSLSFLSQILLSIFQLLILYFYLICF